MILDLPNTESGIARVIFDPQRVDYAAPEASGRQGGVQAGWPVWIARFELDRSDPVSGDQWRAFFSRLRGRIRRFYAGDPTRPFPSIYRQGFAGMTRAVGGAFDGPALGWAQNINADGDAQIGLTGLPANMILKTGDYIGFKWDAPGSAAGSYDRRTMMRLVENATASSGGAVTVIAEPPLNTALVPAGAIAHFDRPVVVMQLVPEESDLGPIGAGLTMGGGKIVAVQDLRL